MANIEDELTVTIDGKEWHTGYTRLGKYLECPQAYKYEYVDKTRGKPSTPMARGSAYHDTLDVLRKFKIRKGREMRLPRALEWATYYAEQHSLVPSVVGQVRNGVAHWWEKLYPHLDFLFSEMAFEIRRGEVLMTGRIDSGLSTGKVIDDKFSFDLWPDGRARSGVQPIIYQWAWESVIEPEYGVKYKGFEYHIVRTFPYPSHQTVEVGRLNPVKSLNAERHVAGVSSSIQAGLFYRNPEDGKCGRCSHKTACQPLLYRVKSHTDSPSPAD